MATMMKFIQEIPKMKKNQRCVSSGRVEKKNDVLIDRHYSCPCCGLLMTVEACDHVICPECAWMEDPEQSADHDLSEGKNAMSLNEAKAALIKPRNGVLKPLKKVSFSSVRFISKDNKA